MIVRIPHFEPRAFARQPRQFGRELAIDWWPLDDGASDLLDQRWAAMTQHRLAFTINREARDRYGSVRDWCDSVDVRHFAMSQILRGAVPADLEDLGRAGRSLGLDLFWSVVRHPEELADLPGTKTTGGGYRES